MAKKNTAEICDNCIKQDVIDILESGVDKHEKKIYGSNGSDGIDKVLTRVDTNLNNHIDSQKIWQGNFWKVAIVVGGLLITNLGWNAVDHYKILRFPKDYVSKVYMDTWLDELQEQTKIMRKMAMDVALGKIDSFLIRDKQLENIQKKNTLYNRLRAIRGGNSSYVKKDTANTSLGLNGVK